MTILPFSLLLTKSKDLKLPGIHVYYTFTSKSKFILHKHSTQVCFFFCVFFSPKKWQILILKRVQKKAFNPTSCSHRRWVLLSDHLKQNCSRIAGFQNYISDKTFSKMTVVWLSSKRLLELIHQKINKHKRNYHRGTADITGKKNTNTYTFDKMEDTSR